MGPSKPSHPFSSPLHILARRQTSMHLTLPPPSLTFAGFHFSSRAPTSPRLTRLSAETLNEVILLCLQNLKPLQKDRR